MGSLKLYSDMTDDELAKVDLVQFTGLKIGDRVTHAGDGWKSYRDNKGYGFLHPQHGKVWILHRSGGGVWHSQHSSEGSHTPSDDSLHPSARDAKKRLERMSRIDKANTGTIVSHQNHGLYHWGGLCVTVTVKWDDGSKYDMVYSLAKKV